ncbi:MAG: AtpZ/AtpI family protein [Cyclobacteriaceae bacterium]|nr:AtpZ/AtpI family protein [Cyclobacteriaceae bacterium]
METDKNKEFLKKQKSYNDFAKYSGLAIQMGVTIYLGNLLGNYIDENSGNTSALYTKIVTLLSVFLSIYLVINQVIKRGELDE